jgi:osmotically-inducible protein OsmY
MATYDNRDRDRRRDRRCGEDGGVHYDPDHEYRARRHRRHENREEPYAQRPMPGEHAERERDRRLTRQQAAEERAWAEPSAWLGAGGYRGVGPKDYVRSDERIRELVCDDLSDDEWLDASRIEVTVKDGEVTLSGSVASRDAKRLAEDLAEHAGGVKHVQNNLRIEPRR